MEQPNSRRTCGNAHQMPSSARLEVGRKRYVAAASIYPTEIGRNHTELVGIHVNA